MRALSFPAIPPRWLRYLLIFFQLLLSVALVFVASRSRLMLLLLLLVGVGLAIAFLRRPVLGLMVAATAGLVVPYLGPSGLNVTMILVALLLGLWLLDMIGRQSQIRLAFTRSLWPLLAFLFIAFVSFGVGQLPWFKFALHAPLGAQLGGLALIVLSAATFLLAANQLNDLAWLRRLCWAFLAMAALTIIFRSILPALGISTRQLFQPVGTVFYIWLVAIAFSQAVFNQELKLGWRLMLGGLVIVTFFVLLFLKFDDKSGWISCLVCLVVIVGFLSWRTLLALVPVGAVTAFLLWTELIVAEGYSISTRYEAWVIIGRIIKISPIWGLGFANYYWYTPLFPIRGYAVSFNSHNNYVDIVAQTGAVGLICFLLFLWELGRLGWRLRKQAPAGFARAYVYGAFGALVGMAVAGMLGDWVLPFFYNIGLSGFRTSMLGWLFLGGLVSVEQIINRSVPQSVDQPGL